MIVSVSGAYAKLCCSALQALKSSQPRLKRCHSAKPRTHTDAIVLHRAAAKYEKFSRAHGSVTYDCLCAPLESGAYPVLCMYYVVCFSLAPPTQKQSGRCTEAERLRRC